MSDQEPSETLKAVLTREIPLEYYGAADVVGIFADQAMVSHSAGVFTLFFFQTQLPLLATPEDLANSLQALPARCVSRIVLTPILMQQFLGALNTNMERYKAIVDQQAKQGEEK